MKPYFWISFFKAYLQIYKNKCSDVIQENIELERKRLGIGKVIIEGKLFQRYTHLLYCSELSLGGNVNTRRMSKSDMGSIFYIKNQWNILVMGHYYVNYQNFQNLIFFILQEHWCIYSCLKNSAQRELVLICTQSIRNRN